MSVQEHSASLYLVCDTERVGASSVFCGHWSDVRGMFLSMLYLDLTHTLSVIFTHPLQLGEQQRSTSDSTVSTRPVLEVSLQSGLPLKRRNTINIKYWHDT